MMKWSDDDKQAAASCGWLLCDVFDLTKREFKLTVLPTDPSVGVAHMTRAVTNYAKNGDKVALKALRLVVQTPPIKERNETATRTRR